MTDEQQKAIDFLRHALESQGARDVRVVLDSGALCTDDPGVFFTLPSGDHVSVEPGDEHPESPFLSIDVYS